jgi:hypothetical protein
VHLEVPSFAIVLETGACDAFTFLTTVFRIAQIFRGRLLTYIEGDQNNAWAGPDLYSETLGIYKDEVEGLRGRAQNLRFWPEPCACSEEDFCSAAMQHYWEYPAAPALEDEDVDMWVEYAREWMAEGV